MDGKDTTVAELIAELQKQKPNAIVRVSVTHDLVEIVKQGPVVGLLRKAKRGLIILECSDDCSHGFGKK
jgi:hypothetical protein